MIEETLGWIQLPTYQRAAPCQLTEIDSQYRVVAYGLETANGALEAVYVVTAGQTVSTAHIPVGGGVLPVGIHPQGTEIYLHAANPQLVTITPYVSYRGETNFPLPLLAMLYQYGGGGAVVPAHHLTHEDGASDEINVAGLSGVLADAQNANQLQGRDVSAVAPADGQLLAWVNAATEWQPVTGPTNSVCIYYPAQYDTNYLNYRVQNVAGTGSWRFTFHVPIDLGTVLNLCLAGIPQTGAGGAGKDIDLSSSYATVGEPANTHAETDTTSTYDLGTVGDIVLVDLTSVFSALSANDYCGVLVDHNSIGGTVSYFGVLLNYTRA